MISSIVSRLSSAGVSFDAVSRHVGGLVQIYRVDMTFVALVPKPIFEGKNNGPMTNDRFSVVEDDRGNVELSIFRNANGFTGGVLETRKWVEKENEVFLLAGV